MAASKGNAGPVNGNGKRPANPENPFIHIPFARPDLTSTEVQGGGAKELVPITPAYRQALARTLDTAQASLASDLAIYPNALGTLVFKLRDTGVAKTHRPVTLASESGVLPAGHAGIDEMLVGAHAASIAQLRWAIMERTTGKIRANLSAIELISGWTRERRMPQGLDTIRNRGSMLIRPFRYLQPDATDRNVSILRNLLLSFNIAHQIIPFKFGGVPLFRIVDLDSINEATLDDLMAYPGIREAYAEPMYSTPQAHESTSLPVPPPRVPFPVPSADLPVVGVFDTGVSPRATVLRPWIQATETYVLPPDTNHEHGTMVASLVAGAHALNASHSWIPRTGCRVVDASGLEAGSGYISILIERLRDVVPKYPDVRVWNLSLGGSECPIDCFSEFAQVLDELTDTYGVLFVVAAGNYLDLPRRQWPNPATLQDRVSSPGESVRSLTVGAIGHKSEAGSMSLEGDPTPYSRRGPGPIFTPKPDIVHVGGGVHVPWNPGPASLGVMSPTNMLIGSFGTSFAAPIASTMAAHTWHSLQGRTGRPPNPNLVKALMIHAAQLASPHYSAFERRYYGVGRPAEVIDSLYDRDDSFTLVFEALVFPGMRWRKSPFPIPAALLVDGKFKGEIIITAVYSPPLDPNAGSEYVRANVEVSFGVLDGDSIKGRVPMQSDEGQSGYEALQIEHGGKWSPVKVHRKRFPQGTAGDVWALQAGVNLRAFEPAPVQALPVTILVTLRSLSGDVNVHADGLRALNQSNWIREVLPARVPVRT